MSLTQVISRTYTCRISKNALSPQDLKYLHNVCFKKLSCVNAEKTQSTWNS